jgi:hypothetical protein
MEQYGKHYATQINTVENAKPPQRQNATLSKLPHIQ